MVKRQRIQARKAPKKIKMLPEFNDDDVEIKQEDLDFYGGIENAHNFLLNLEPSDLFDDHDHKSRQYSKILNSYLQYH